MTKKKRHNLAAIERDLAARERNVSAAPATPARSPAVEELPVHECLVNADWQTPGALVRLVVARGTPEGRFVAGTALVDLGCLGVKDAFARRFSSFEKYLVDLRGGAEAFGDMIEIDLDLAAKIVYEGIAYARALGFEPHPDFRKFEPLLAGANPDAATEEVPLGVDGKPFFISGPYDNVNTILAKLNQAVGEGNYHFMVGGPAPDLFDV